MRRDKRRKKKKEVVAGDANLTIMLRLVSRESINKQPITTQSEYAYKVPPVRRQGQILTLVQIYWRGKISRLLQATRCFLIFFLSLLFSSRRFVALLFENLWHPRQSMTVDCMVTCFIGLKHSALPHLSPVGIWVSSSLRHVFTISFKQYYLMIMHFLIVTFLGTAAMMCLLYIG